MKVIYVDDETALLDNFRMTVEGLSMVEELNLFRKSEEALKWAQNHPVEVAFLDIQMPGINGIELAKRLKGIDRNIRIVFVTAYEQYALEAFGVDAIGYLLKPYFREDVEKELEKASYIGSRPKKKIEIQTMPDLLVTVNGSPLHLGHTKHEELFALLVDRGDVGITGGEAIACLWPDKTVGDSIYWVTMSRLKDKLKEVGIDNIIGTDGKTKYLRTDQVECDLYRILSGKKDAIADYHGAYLKRFSWAEERNAQLAEQKIQWEKDTGSEK
ncbi:MAG: response regulator [Eubacteriales bacterium]|nr:response regulator [Eubacteriales bacterium]